MRELLASLDKPDRVAVGLMSGTSADGIDAALCRIHGTGIDTRVETLAFVMTPFDSALRERVLAAGRAQVGEISALNFKLGEVFAEATIKVIEYGGLRPEDVDFVASHGQTVHHHPGGGDGERSTLQIAEGAVIAQRTGIPVVCDFRVRDVAAGGSGAPLVPYVDYMLFRDPVKTRVLLNLGGIVNLTIVPGGASLDEVIAFDVGPCNMLLDGLAELLLDRPCDTGGEVAGSGRPSQRLVDEILTHPFYAARPPKSTGRELFHDRFISSVLSSARRMGLTDRDTLASAALLVGTSVARALETLVTPRFRHPDEIVVAGGGVHNKAIMAGLESAFRSAAVVTSREYGIHPDAKEAIAFAILGNESLAGNPSNLPAATGARERVVLGAFIPGRRRPPG
jgi:anhydro-N-acetylmuramic acid kinase